MRKHSVDEARKKLTRMVEELKDVAEVEIEPTIEGRKMSMLLKPKTGKNAKRG